VNDPPLLIAELACAYNQSKSAPEENPHQEGSGPPTQQHTAAAPSGRAGLAGTVTLGGWLHIGKFADQRFDSQGGLLADTSALPLQHSGNFAVYVMINQTLGHDGGEVNGFVRVVAAPADRNLIDLYLDAGLTFNDLINSRPDDTVGLGVASGRISPPAAAHDRDLAVITGMPMPVRDYEAAIELTYQMQVAPNWSVQPDLQFIVISAATSLIRAIRAAPRRFPMLSCSECGPY
jgi:carbohydrate-selective porin OprB